MNPIKIAVIGAGSSYTPEIVEGLALSGGRLPVGELAFMDIDPQRLEIMSGFCRRYMRHLQGEIPITTTTHRIQAIQGAAFVIIQIRVGGNRQRVLDEKIPMKYGIIGQETTGPGGMLKAFRTVPVVLDIAREVEQYSPQAWMINYTNPTGLITEAVLGQTHAKVVGVCSYGVYPRWVTSMALGVPEEDISYNYVGLNHFNFAFNIKVRGRLVSAVEFDKIAGVDRWSSIDPLLVKKLRLIPSPYLQYYFHTGRKLAELKSQPQSRGEAVQDIEKELFAELADESCITKPAVLMKRGSGHGGYSEVAAGIMDAIYNNREKIMFLNVLNRGAVPFLPPDAVIETPCVVNASGITPLQNSEIPRPVWGILSAVKNYEQLAVEAAVTGNRDTALLALLAHPLVREYDVAAPLLDEMLEANETYLPQFFKEN